MSAERFNASCTGKTPYLSKADAVRILKHRAKRGRLRPYDKCGGALQAYRCRYCHNWHVGAGKFNGEHHR